MKKLLLLTLCCFGLVLSAAAQATVSGKVSAAADGSALPGVTVLIKGTSQGTQTDMEGKYTLKVEDGAILVFSFIGLETQEVAVGGRSVIDVSMAENSLQLQEIVVTALGIKRTKKSLGYAQQTVDAEELISTKQADVVNAMAGKIAGVQVMAAPKSGFNQSQIRLRGSTDVLYVVDGIRLQNSDDVNPEDVASMSVLKGSAATALYGPAGRNGVVIITTSRAKKSGPTLIYDGAIEISTADYLPELQNEYGGGYSQTFPKFSYDPSRDPASWASFDGQDMVEYYADESWGPKLDGRMVRQWDSWVPSNPNFGKMTPWVSNGGVGEFFETGVNKKHSITFLKSGEGFNLKLNLLRNDNTLNVPGASRENTRGSIGADFDVTSKLNASVNVSFQNRNTVNNPTEGYGSVGANVFQWWQGQLDVDKLKNYRQGGNVVSWNINSPRNTKPLYWDSPYFELYENVKTQSRRALISNITLKYQFTDYLSSNLSYKKTYEMSRFDARTAWGGLEVPAYSEREFTEDVDLLTGQLVFNKDFNDLSVAAIAGFEVSNYNLEDVRSASTNGLTVPDFYSIATSKERPSYSRYLREIKSRAAYLTTTLGYKDMVFLDASLRRDWSSTAKVGANSVTSVGASMSFVFSELLPQNDILTYGKLRFGIAQGPSFPNAYGLSPTYNTLPNFGTTAVASMRTSLTNANLTGGLRQEVEIGAEMRFLQGKIGLDVAYFTKTDSDLPTGLTLDPTTGYGSVLVNSGKQTYKGVEVAISGSPIDTDNFTWNTSFNFATLRRDVVALAEGITQSDARFLPDRWGGLILRDQEGERWGEIYGTKVKEINGKKVISSAANFETESSQSLGNYLPDFTGGFINRLKYKNFSLNIDMDYQIGGKYFSITQMFINYSGLGASTAGSNGLGNPKRDPVLNSSGDAVSYVPAAEAGAGSGGTLMSGVDADGTDVAYYVATSRYWGNQFGNISEFTYNASYLSVRNVRLGYQLPKSIVEKVKMQGINVAFYINNALLLFSDLPNVDPSQLESSGSFYASPNNETLNFMEGGQLPGVRTYGFNVRLTL